MLKQVVVEAKKGFKLFGKNIRPNEVNTFNIRQIFGLLGVGGGVKVFEVLPDGTKIRLNKENYDKVNYSSVSSVANTEIDHKEPGNINEGNPIKPDESSNEDSPTTTTIISEGQKESELVEEPGIINEEQEPIIEESVSDINDENTPDESSIAESALPTEEPGTDENEESVVEEELVADDANVEVEEVTETADAVASENANVRPVNNNNGYNMPKKANGYKK